MEKGQVKSMYLVEGDMGSKRPASRTLHSCFPYLYFLTPPHVHLAPSGPVNKEAQNTS